MNDFNNVRYRMDAEGLHYCFDGYSDWHEIQDPEFQRLRKAYLDAAAALESYVNAKATDEDE